jgi:hypothetical protein
MKNTSSGVNPLGIVATSHARRDDEPSSTPEMPLQTYISRRITKQFGALSCAQYQ